MCEARPGKPLLAGFKFFHLFAKPWGPASAAVVVMIAAGTWDVQVAKQDV